MFTDFFKNLKDELKNDLPGEKAHMKMAPGIRDYFKPKSKVRKAGVLILLYQKNQELYIAFVPNIMAHIVARFLFLVESRKMKIEIL